MRDAVAVGNHERRARILFGLPERPHRLGVVAAEGDLGDVDVAVADRDQPQVLLRVRLPAEANLATAPRGVAFDAWPPVFE